MMTIAVTALASTIALLGNQTYPEGIVVHPYTHDLYVGSNGDGSIQIIHDGVAHQLQPAGTDGRTAAYGMKIDGRRGRLWIAGGDAVYVYDLAENELLKKIPLREVIPTESAALNDIALSIDGSAYVTDSYNPNVMMVDGSTFTMTIFKNVGSVIPYGQQNGFSYNLNGIVLTSDERSLISVKTNDGTLWRLDRHDGEINEIKLEVPITKGDGLVLIRGILYVMRNFENRISRIDLTQGADDVARPVETFAPEGIQVPTTAAYLGPEQEALAIVNSQFDKEVPVLPFNVLVLPLSSLTSSGQ